MNDTAKGHRMSNKESFNMLMNEFDKAFICMSKEELDIIFDMVFNDTSVKMATDHLGTFVEIKETGGTDNERPNNSW